MVKNSLSPLHLSGRLIHHYAVDTYAKVEQDGLNYIHLNQEVWVDLYSGLADAVAASDTPKECGSKVVRMFELYHDALSM